MARIRTIKPSFFTSLTIGDLTPEQRLTYIGLWTHCDDEGRCVYEPRLIRAAIWPLDDRSLQDITDDVCAISERSLIVHYVVRGRAYLAIESWHEHQKINRPQPSALPPLEEGEIVPLTCSNARSLNDHGTFTEPSLLEGKGREGKGKELKDSSAFDEFWAAYPRKDDKARARKAWDTATRTTDAATITAGAHRYAADPNRDPTYTKQPATWLNAQSWANGPLPIRFDRNRPTQAGPTGTPMSTGEQRARAALEIGRQLQAAEDHAQHQIGM